MPQRKRFGREVIMKIALRMDDITADMNWDNFFRLKELFDKAGVRPLLGVVPDNRDASFPV